MSVVDLEESQQGFLVERLHACAAVVAYIHLHSQLPPFLECRPRLGVHSVGFRAEDLVKGFCCLQHSQVQSHSSGPLCKFFGELMVLGFLSLSLSLSLCRSVALSFSLSFALWLSGSLALWLSGSLALSLSRPLALPPSRPPALSLSRSLALSLSRSVALSPSPPSLTRSLTHSDLLRPGLVACRKAGQKERKKEGAKGSAGGEETGECPFNDPMRSFLNAIMVCKAHLCDWMPFLQGLPESFSQVTCCWALHVYSFSP